MTVPPAGGSGQCRITATGQSACRGTCWLTEPSSRPAKPTRPHPPRSWGLLRTWPASLPTHPVSAILASTPGRAQGTATRSRRVVGPDVRARRHGAGDPDTGPDEPPPRSRSHPAGPPGNLAPTAPPAQVDTKASTRASDIELPARYGPIALALPRDQPRRGQAPESRPGAGYAAVRGPGTTATGQAAWCRTAWLTEPSSRPVKPPRPRVPTTTSWARWVASMSALRAPAWTRSR